MDPQQDHGLCRRKMATQHWVAGNALWVLIGAFLLALEPSVPVMPLTDPVARAAWAREDYQKNKTAKRQYNADRWHSVQKHRKAENTANRRRVRYNLTTEQFDAMSDRQSGMCALCCLRPLRDVDHCHTTNKVRGLLCRACNLGLGMFGDSPERLVRAIAYLQRNE